MVDLGISSSMGIAIVILWYTETAVNVVKTACCFHNLETYPIVIPLSIGNILREDNDKADQLICQL